METFAHTGCCTHGGVPERATPREEMAVEWGVGDVPVPPTGESLRGVAYFVYGGVPRIGNPHWEMAGDEVDLDEVRHRKDPRSGPPAHRAILCVKYHTTKKRSITPGMSS